MRISGRTTCRSNGGHSSEPIRTAITIRLAFGKAPAAAAEVPADPSEDLTAIDQAALG
jgi:hypothetical protein